VNSFQDGMEAANDAVYSYHSQKVMKTTIDSFKKSELTNILSCSSSKSNDKTSV